VVDGDVTVRVPEFAVKVRVDAIPDDVPQTAVV